ncbi:MAG: tetratricopeptide repeat protein [Myxococcota bacterium]|jgi:tetratricopeptide (TPR) repeat protein
MKRLILISLAAAVLLAFAGNAQAQKAIEFKVPNSAPAQNQAVEDDELVIPPEAMEKPPPAGRRKKADPVDDAFVPAGAVVPQPAEPIPPEPQAAPDAGRSAPADAGTTAKENTPKAEQTRVAEPEFRAILLDVPKEGLQDIHRHWEARREALDLHDVAKADAGLSRIATIRADNGLKNLFRISSALVSESRAAVKSRDYATAGSLAAMAAQLAPDLPSAHLQRATVTMSRNKTDFVSASRHIVSTFQSIARDPVSSTVLMANAALVAVFAAIAALMLFVITMLVRYLRLLIHDLSHLFPDGSPFLLTGAISILVLFVPLILGFGLIPSILFWSAAIWLYASIREKVVLAAGCIVFSLLPLGYPWAAVLLDQGDSDATSIYRALQDADATADVARMIAEAKDGSGDPLKQLTGGLWLKRTGKFADAEKAYKHAAELMPSDPAPQINLGNLYLVQDRYKEAMAAYNTAISLDPANALAHLNTSQLFFRRGELEKGQRERAEANRLDPAIGDAIAVDSSSINRVVLDAEPDRHEIIERMLARNSTRRALITGLLERLTVGDLGRSDMPFLLAAMVVLLIALNSLGGRLGAAEYCVKCGRPACLHCNPEMRTRSFCGQCFHVYQMRDVLDPRLRNIKDIECGRHAADRLLRRRVCSIIIPGSGQVLLDHPLRGLFVMFAVSLSAIFIVTGGGPVPGRFPDLHQSVMWLEYGAGTAGVIVYLTASWSAFKG